MERSLFPFTGTGPYTPHDIITSHLPRDGLRLVHFCLLRLYRLLWPLDFIN